MSRELEQRIFTEIKQATTNMSYAELILDRQTKREKLYTGSLALLTSAGGISALTDLFKGSVIATSLSLAFATIASLVVIGNKFSSLYLKSAKEVADLCQLYVEFSRYSDELQNLLADLREERTTDSIIQNKLLRINDKYSSSKIMVSSLFGKIDKKLNQLAADRSDYILIPIYNESQSNNE